MEEDDEPGLAGRLRQLGARLREARDHAGLSQEDVCARIDSTSRSLARWEGGEVEPGFVTMQQLAELYGVSLDWLAGRTTLPPLLLPGRVMVDERALERIRRLVDEGGSMGDVPETLLRHPVIAYAFVVPEQVLMLGVDAARAIDGEMQQLLKKLRGRA